MHAFKLMNRFTWACKWILKYLPKESGSNSIPVFNFWMDNLVASCTEYLNHSLWHSNGLVCLQAVQGSSNFAYLKRPLCFGLIEDSSGFRLSCWDCCTKCRKVATIYIQFFSRQFKFVSMQTNQSRSLQ
jgi:hypothetical protein